MLYCADPSAGVSDPEKKRKIIGSCFIDVFQEEAHKIGQVDYLLQGTLYPDVIESISYKGPSATIKTHHNVGGLPDTMHLKLIEPLRELFKDEVRELGESIPSVAAVVCGACVGKDLFNPRGCQFVSAVHG